MAWNGHSGSVQTLPTATMAMCELSIAVSESTREGETLRGDSVFQMSFEHDEGVIFGV